MFMYHLGMCAKLMFTFACVRTHVQVPSSCLQMCGHMEKEHGCKWSCMQSLCLCLQVCGHVCRIHVCVYRCIEPMYMFTGVCGHVYRAHVHLCGCPLSVLSCMVHDGFMKGFPRLCHLGPDVPFTFHRMLRGTRTLQHRDGPRPRIKGIRVPTFLPPVAPRQLRAISGTCTGGNVSEGGSWWPSSTCQGSCLSPTAPNPILGLLSCCSGEQAWPSGVVSGHTKLRWQRGGASVRQL